MGLFRIAFLNRDARFHIAGNGEGERSHLMQFASPYLLGLAFAFGWTPCIGPILATILTIAAAQESLTAGATLLTVYSLGLGIPLFISSLSVQTFLAYFKKTARYLWLVSGVSGLFLVAVGVLIFTNSLTRLTSFFSRIGIGWSIGQ